MAKKDTLKIENNGNYYGVVDKNNTVVIPYEYDEIVNTFSSGLINVCKKDKWGCLDLEGNIVVPLIYDCLSPFEEDSLDTTSAKRNGKWGMINRKGKEIILCVYDNEIVFNKNSAIVSLNGKIGKIDKKGKEIIPCQYTCIEPFVNSSRLFKVMENDKWGIIDTKGSIVVPLIYDEIGDLFKDYVIIKQNGFFGVVNLRGEIIIPNMYNKIDRTFHGTNRAKIDSHCEFFAVLNNNKWGYIIANNDNRDNIKYDWISGPWDNDYYVVKSEKNYGIVNRRGEIIFPITYSKIGVYYDRDSCSSYFELKTKGQKSTIIPCQNNKKKKLAKIDEHDNIELKNIGAYEIVEPINKQKSLYIVRKTDKTGVVKAKDNDVEIVVPLEYNEIQILRKIPLLLLAKNSSLQRVIEIAKNKTIMSQFYDNIGDYNDSGRFIYLGIIPVYSGSKVGIINESFEEIIPIQYDILDDRAFHIINVGVFGREIALVMKKNDRWGILNKAGKVLLPFEYDKIDYNTTYYRWFKQNIRDWGFTRVNGSGLIPVCRNNKWGLVELQKYSLVAQCIYESICQETVNKLKLIKKKGYDLLLLTKDGPQITYTSTEKLVKYSTVRKFKNGFAIVQKDKKYGYVDDAYNEIAPCIYDKASSFEDGIAIVKRAGKYGCIDERGSEFIPCKYDVILPFSHGIAVVKIGELYGAVNTKGRIVVPVEYQLLADITVFGNSPILMAVKNRRFGAVDKKNSIIVPFEYDLIESPVFDGMIKVSKNGKKGVFNKTGVLVVPIQYDEIEIHYATAGTYSVCNNGKWGVLKNGENITQLIYDKIDDFGFACGRLAVCRNTKWGFIDRKGQEVIPCIYDEVFQFFEDNHCTVKLNGEKMTIDIYGNRIG